MAISGDTRRLVIGRDRNIFKVLAGNSFTVPDTKTNAAVLSPLAVGSVSRTSGGEIVAEINDEPGFVQRDIGWKLEPGDVIAVSAIAANKATMTITSRDGILVATWVIETVTDAAGVIGFWN